MPDWLRHTFPNGASLTVQDMAIRLATALALGCVVGGIYRLTHGRDRGSRGLLSTLVLLTVLIAMVTLVIGDNVARAFSLVGALAIVRFRTVVADTRDTAFVIFAVAVGMAIGAGFLAVPLVGIPVAAVAAFLFRPEGGMFRPAGQTFQLTVRVGVGHDPAELLRAPFAKHLLDVRLTGTATARQGAAVDLTYTVLVRDEEAPLRLVSELNVLEGVQAAEMRQE